MRSIRLALACCLFCAAVPFFLIAAALMDLVEWIDPPPLERPPAPPVDGLDLPGEDWGEPWRPRLFDEEDVA